MKAPNIEHKCAQCGSEFSRNQKGVKKSGRVFCDADCYAIYYHVTLSRALEHVDKLTSFERMLVVDMPLKGYNAFLGRNVTKDAFVKVIEELARLITRLKFLEYFIFAAYYIAAGRDGSTFVELDDMFKVFPSANAKIVNRYILVASRADPRARVAAVMQRDIDDLVAAKIINDKESEGIKLTIDRLKLASVASRSRTAAHAAVYIASIASGASIGQSAFSEVCGVSTVSLRTVTRRLIEELGIDGSKFSKIYEEKSKTVVQILRNV